jgi:hypothetical protein
MRNTVEQLRADDSRRDTVSSDKAIRREWRPAAEEIERLCGALQEIANSDERIAEVRRTRTASAQQIGRLLPNSDPPRSNPPRYSSLPFLASRSRFGRLAFLMWVFSMCGPVWAVKARARATRRSRKHVLGPPWIFKGPSARCLCRGTHLRDWPFAVLAQEDLTANGSLACAGSQGLCLPERTRS